MVSWDRRELLRTVSIRLLVHFPKATDFVARPHSSLDCIEGLERKGDKASDQFLVFSAVC